MISALFGGTPVLDTGICLVVIGYDQDIKSGYFGKCRENECLNATLNC